MCVGLIEALLRSGTAIGWEGMVERTGWALPLRGSHSSGETFNITKTEVMISLMGMSTLKKMKQRNRRRLGGYPFGWGLREAVCVCRAMVQGEVTGTASRCPSG